MLKEFATSWTSSSNHRAPSGVVFWNLSLPSSSSSKTDPRKLWSNSNATCIRYLVWPVLATTKMAKIKEIACVKNAIWSSICYQPSKDCTRSVVKLTNTARNSTPAQDLLPNKLESLTLPQSSLVPSLEDRTVVDLHQCRRLVVFQLPTASQTNHTIRVSAPKIQASPLLRWAAMA